MATIETRERAQIKGGKMLAILKGEMLNSRSFVHLKPTYYLLTTAMYGQHKSKFFGFDFVGLSFSPVVFVIADPWTAVHHLVHLHVAEE